MKRSFSAGIALVALLTVACGGATAPGAVSPSGAAKPASGSAAAAKPAANWDQIVAAGKSEGKLIILGPQGDQTRDALTLGFQKQYPGIQVDYTGLAGDQLGPKVITPVAAGQHLTDLAITGTTTAIEALMPANAIVPLKDYLVGPNDTDQSKWLNGRFHYADDAAVYNLVFSEYVKAPFVFNPSQASITDFKSNKNLLDPKWKGKIIMRNPLGPGPGLSVVTYWYTTDSLGKDFIKQLFSTQDVIMSNDDRQILEGVARGTYPIGIGPSDVLTNEYVSRGLAVKHMPGDLLAEKAYVTAGNGSVVVVKDPPHPNAVKLYLDYLLSKDGELEWVKAAGFASLRTDVPHDTVLDIMVPKEGVEYIEQQNEPYVKTRNEIVSFVTPLIPK